ncbi:MAG: apolipoprotein N-acyltransferase [Candidatus Omnitrophica bacterium]|nr:apolipoprotein N-acyltransferase [Candidatus Omnitrophota bacterium]
MALGSAGLLLFAFPNFNQPWAVWVALVPWLVLLRRVPSPRVAFRWSWLIGFLFFLGSIWWLCYVTVFGWIVLCAYLAVYFGVFGWFVHGVQDAVLDSRLGTRDPSHESRVSSLLLVPSAWVALEFARSHLLSGLGWNLLAYSQTPWLPVIQLADITGAWGISFLIVLVNVGLAEAIQVLVAGPAAERSLGEPSLSPPRSNGVSGPPSRERLRVTRHPQVFSMLAIPVAGLLAALGYGTWRMQRVTKKSHSARVAVVQGNIPQEKKWDEAFAETILQRYEALTRKAAAAQPDLIVWPETSVPGYFDIEEDLTQRILSLAREVKRPLLVGSPVPTWTAEGFRFVNRAVLLGADGAILQQYDKLHLVPYGEFIPGDRWLPWLRKLLPPTGDFVPGKEYTVFETRDPRPATRDPSLESRVSSPTHTFHFSVLICFEDVFPELAREFVRRGARTLLVITNDAWFGPTAAAYQHTQASIFRAVELRVPVIRAANTGWSGCIDALGRPIAAVREGSRELFVEATAACDVPLANVPGPYRDFGDWFAWGCLLAAMSVMLPAIITVSRSRRSVRGR